MMGSSCQLRKKGEDLVGAGGTVESLAKELIQISPHPDLISFLSPHPRDDFYLIRGRSRRGLACFVLYSELKNK